MRKVNRENKIKIKIFIQNINKMYNTTILQEENLK